MKSTPYSHAVAIAYASASLTSIGAEGSERQGWCVAVKIAVEKPGNR